MKGLNQTETHAAVAENIGKIAKKTYSSLKLFQHPLFLLKFINCVVTLF